MNASNMCNLVSILLATLVAASAFAMLQQFHLTHKPFLHHTYLCAAIIALAAFAVHKLKQRNILIKIALLFSFGGMLLGIAEIILIVIQ